VLGDVNGQNGWGYMGNSPTLGNVVTAPIGTPSFLGSQSLHLTSTTNSGFFGVANGVYSWRHTDQQAGESSTRAASNSWSTSFYFRTPDSFNNPAPGFGDTLVQFNPAFRPTDADAAIRYAFFGLTCLTDVNGDCTLNSNSNYQYCFVLSDYSDPNNGTDSVSADNINPATWYRIEYSILLVDGLVPPNNGNNDQFTATVYDVTGTLLGSAKGGTWEAPWQTGAFGGGTGPRILSSMDFLRRQGPEGISLGYIDNLAELNEIPEPSTFVAAAGALLALVALRRRSQ